MIFGAYLHHSIIARSFECCQTAWMYRLICVFLPGVYVVRVCAFSFFHFLIREAQLPVSTMQDTLQKIERNVLKGNEYIWQSFRHSSKGRQIL